MTIYDLSATFLMLFLGILLGQLVANKKIKRITGDIILGLLILTHISVWIYLEISK